MTKKKEIAQPARPLIELGPLLDAVMNEALWGQMYLWLWRDLGRALAEKPNVAKISPNFFRLTLSACIYEIYLRLSKLFDKRPDAASLRNLLEYARKSEGAFKKAKPEEVRKLLEQVEATVNELESEAAPVLAGRHKRLAHLDLRAVADPSAVQRETQIPVAQLENIYQKAGQLLNHISGIYRDATTRMELICWDDFRKLLERAEQGEQAWCEDWRKRRGR